ncbi:MAG: YebG family protein [Desulfobacteraceae bacterium]|nr:YebG family protein [Desulfobacteraceae bacterium]
MAVEVRYHVIRNGKEVGMYTSKKEADEHDKMLDIAEKLFVFIGKAENVDIKEDSLDELTVYLSRNREEVIRILKNIKPKMPQAKAAASGIDDDKKAEDKPGKGKKK